MGWGLPGVLRFLPSPTVVPRDRIAETLRMVPQKARLLDVGAGGRRIAEGVETFDAVDYPGVDVVGDIHDLPFPDDYYDCVFCTGTLEHVRDPRKAVSEIHRILKPGGVVYIDVPFIQGYHADPTDYWRFTLDGLRLLCDAFDENDSGVHIGPTCGLVWIAREWANSLTANRYLSNIFLIAMALLTAPLKFLDYLAVRSSRSHRVASAVYFRGRKPARKVVSLAAGPPA